MKPHTIALIVLLTAANSSAQDQPDLQVPRQPLLAHVHRLIEAMDVVGNPFDDATLKKLTDLKSLDNNATITRSLRKILAPHVLATVDVQADGAPNVTLGKASRDLLEQGWRTFLVEVINRPGRTQRLLIESPNARPLPHAPASEVTSRWMQLSAFDGQPMKPNLSGLPLEYRIIQIYSRDTGSKTARLEFAVSKGPGADSELIREWRFNDDTDGWMAMNQSNIEALDGSLAFESVGEDPFIGADVEARGGPLTLRFWAKADVGGIGQLFWWTKDRPSPTADRQTNFIIEKDKEHLYEIPFAVDGTLAGIRIDPLVRPGNMRIDWIDLHSDTRSSNWANVDINFDSRPATKLTFRVIDADGNPGFARFEIKDSKGRIYPAQSKRLAPDFFFQRHIYRGDGESVSLPADTYTIVCSRGPESIPETKQITLTDEPEEFVYRVSRWVNPSKSGWWSGDHHIHAAGCLHYNNPTQGVQPEDMIRHIMGEDLKVGCCLTWGPCFDFQKRFFTGDTAEESSYPYTLRYDVEVSGFGSHMSGHLNLLNLKEQIYPGGESKDHWPTLGLNTLRWAKSQGAICGPAHSSIGLSRYIGRVPNTEGKDGKHNLPNYNIPAYDGIGANEFIMNVAHKVPGPDGKLVPAVDFISTMNTERVAEWNMWYHVMNCGFRTVASGETDFPCLSGERVGIGRVYAEVDGDLTFTKWIDSIAAGRSYVSDGFCHLLDYKAQHSTSGSVVDMGVNGSELQIASDEEVEFSVSAIANLPDGPDLEVELIVNGEPVQTQTIAADSSLQDLTFRQKLPESSWVAVRVFPNAHTNPIWVVVDDKPVRGPADSIRWCLAGVEQCWKAKQPTYDADEQADAKAAYDHARDVFQKLLNEAQ